MKYIFGKVVGFIEGVIATMLALGATVGAAYVANEVKKDNIKVDGDVGETVRTAFKSGYDLGDKLN